MGARFLLTPAVALALGLAAAAGRAESVDGRVVQVEMPFEDVTLFYVEMKGSFAAELRAPSASVKGSKYYVGDGKVAVTMAVTPGRGIVFQGKTKLDQGFVFQKGSEVVLLPGYKKASDLKPGDVYVTLPGVAFKVPPK